MKAESKIMISLNDNDRRLLYQVKDILEDTAQLLRNTDGEVDIDDSDDYNLISEVFNDLKEIYNAL